jgi:hypothetical protein
MLLPSRTVYDTKNWPDSGWWLKNGAFGLRFFLRVTQAHRVEFIREQARSHIRPHSKVGTHVKCGSWLACDSGLKAGACFRLKSLSWCKKVDLFISNAPFKFTKATSCAFQVQHELLMSGSISLKNNQFAETSP